MLFVDGRTASTPSAQFPIVEVQIDVAAAGVTRVPFTIYLPILDTAHAINLPLDANGFTTQEVKATTPAIPGLVVTVPLGTRIIGPDGNPVAQLVITPVPVDRSPMPFPPDVSPRMLFAINPGGSVPSQPLPITFPNAGGSTPGTSANLYYFDLAIGTWSIWGQGTVTAGGAQIASNPGAGLPRLAWHFTLPNQVSMEYQYDPASRLTALLYGNAAGPLGDIAYQYDAAGNRLGVGGSFARTLLPDAVATATYDAANRQLAFGGATMGYDANGGLVMLTDVGGATQFGWDARGRLASLVTPSTSAAFTYDALGRRVERHVGGGTTAYVYDGVDVVDELLGASTVSYLRTLAIDEPLSRGASEFYLADALGSTMALTTPDGTLETQYTYSPFGDTAIAGASDNALQFTGREQDGTGLYYYRARYYHPGLQRFVSEDPIGLSGGPNLYAYVNNNPVNYVDPLGLDAFVTIYDSTKQPFGHSGLGVNTTATIGFHPIESATIGDLLPHRPVPGRVVSDKMSHLTRIETFRIPTSLEQDTCLMNFIGQRTADPGLYILGGRSCGEFVRDALQSCGVKGVDPGGFVAPFGLADRLRLPYKRVP
jgi:RHS repeat-associated protein